MPLAFDVLHCGIQHIEMQSIHQSIGGRDDIIEMTLTMKLWMNTARTIDMGILEKAYREALMAAVTGPRPRSIRTVNPNVPRSLIIEE